MKSYYFQEEHDLFRQGLRAFLQKEVLPNVDAWEEAGQIPKSLWKKFGEMGYLGLNFPESLGGSNADFWFSVVYMEEVWRCNSGGFSITPSVISYMASPYLLKHGSDALKEKYLRKTISGDLVCSIAISEPGAGSDVANIATTAVRSGDHYVVNGAKTFITNGVYGDYLVTVVKTAPDLGINGVSLLVVDRHAEGVSARKLKKLGWHASDTAEINFDQVKVPVENLIGAEGQGFYYLMGGLQLERLVGAIGAVSASEAALNYSLQYMSEREAFGRPINKFQVLRHRVAQMASEIEALKHFVYHCCRLHNDGQYAVKECSMAKLLATEQSDKVMYECLQFFGGYGFMEEYKIARMFRDSRVGTIGGGTSEIMREIIAKMVIDDVNYAASAPKQAAPPKPEVPAAQPVQVEASAPAPIDPKPNSYPNPENSMTIEIITELATGKANSAAPLGHTILFELEGDYVHMDGTGPVNLVSNGGHDAECRVTISKEHFHGLLTGKITPMGAFMSGMFRVDGNMSVAMKLGTLFA
jgi:acyl-CoA dehydrogenase